MMIDIHVCESDVYVEVLVIFEYFYYLKQKNILSGKINIC